MTDESIVWTSDDGNARLRVEPDGDADLSYLDGDGYSAEERAEILARADRDGTWGIVAERRCACCGAWMQVDAVWGFVGDDWRGSGYDDDLKHAAQRAADERAP